MREYGQEDNERTEPKKKGLKQWQFNLIVAIAIMAVGSIVLSVIPETKAVMNVIGIGLFFVLKLVWFLVLVAIIFAGPGLISAFLRKGIDSLDEKVEEENKMNNWVHVAICAFVSITLAVIWMAWGIRFIVDLPSWINDIYMKFDWYSRLFESLPWGWGVVTIVSSVIGYLLGNEDNRSEVGLG